MLFLDWYSEPTPCQWLLPARKRNTFTSLWKKKKSGALDSSKFFLHLVIWASFIYMWCLHRKHLPSANWERSSQCSQWSIAELCTIPFVIKNSHPKIKWVSWTLEYLLFFSPRLYREPPGNELWCRWFYDRLCRIGEMNPALNLRAWCLLGSQADAHTREGHRVTG